MKIAAFADAHIGSYLTKIDPETGLNARFLDILRSLGFVAKDSRERGIAELLFAGDMFRTAKPTPTEIVRADVGLGLCQREIIMIDGNHDLPRTASEETALSVLDAPDCYIFHAPQVIDRGPYQLAVLPYPNRAHYAARVENWACLSPEEADCAIQAELCAILHGFRAQLDPGKPSILLAHISIDLAEPGEQPGIMAEREITIPLSSIPEEFTFVCLGHIHKPQDFARNGRPNVFYCGSIDPIDFNEEAQQKSYVLMDLEAGTWERVPISCRPWKTFHLDFKADGDVEDDMPDCEDPANPANGAICRLKVTRPESINPGLAAYEQYLERCRCWHFAGIEETVERVVSVRSEEIVEAETLPELLEVWHKATGCEVPLPTLVGGATELERQVVA